MEITSKDSSLACDNQEEKERLLSMYFGMAKRSNFDPRSFKAARYDLSAFIDLSIRAGS